MEQIRVLIADDHPMFRDGLCALLNSVEGIEVVGEAINGEEVVKYAESYQPDVILMDLQMPGINGIEATRRIVNTSPHMSILVITMYEDNDFVFAAMRAGARGYLLKGADQDEMVLAIRAVANGGAIFSPAIARRLMQYFTALQSTTAPAFPELTEREREVLGLVAQGYTNAVIAERLGITSKTVRNHASTIFSKLQVVDRAQAIILARKAGLGPPAQL